MESRLRLHRTNTPIHHEVVLPSCFTPTHDVEPISEVPSSAERLVVSSQTVARGDCALERLSPSRVAELRMRLATGAYNSPHVMTELAMRLLESGDL